MSAPNAASNSSLQETADQASTGGDRKFLDDAANLILGVTKQVDDITNLIIKALREHTSDDPIQLAALEHLTADLILEKEIKFALADGKANKTYMHGWQLSNRLMQTCAATSSKSRV
jgi:hypothetical protein